MSNDPRLCSPCFGQQEIHGAKSQKPNYTLPDTRQARFDVTDFLIYLTGGNRDIWKLPAILDKIIAIIAICEGLMRQTVKRPRYFLDIDRDLRNRVKASAALRGKTMKEWLTEAIVAKLEDEIDAAEGLASLADTGGTLSLDAYLASRSERLSPRRS